MIREGISWSAAILGVLLMGLSVYGVRVSAGEPNVEVFFYTVVIGGLLTAGGVLFIILDRLDVSYQN